MRKRLRWSLGILAVVAVLAVAGVAGCGASHAASAQEQAAPTTAAALSVTVGKPTGRTIPPGFLGLSLEYPALAAYAGSDANAINPVFLQLIRNLSPGQAPNLRIGGDTTDWTWWPVPGVPKPGGIKYTLTPTWVRVTGALAHQLGARLILGVNFEADSTRVADAQAQALIAGIGRSSIEALELGNEPELYGSFTWYTTPSGRHVTGRPNGYDFGDYQGDFTRVSASLPRLPLAGPATGAPKWIPETGPFLAAHPRVRVATLHRYPLQQCFRPAASPVYPSIAHLLAPAASQGLADSVAPYVGVAHARHVALRVDEMNTVSCGGAPGISNAFVSSLWALDAVFQMARVGVDGVNIHTYPGAPYELFTFTRRNGQWRGFVAPEYYGLLMFAQAAPAGARLLSVSGASGALKAWATRAPDGTVRVVLINEDTARSHTVTLHVAGASAPATLERLRGKGISARTGVTLGGQTFGTDTATGTLAGHSALAMVAPSGGAYVVKLPTASAAMLTIGGAPSG
jgi:Glycosyl hydrolase family 79 C-terminal beta domain